MTRIVLDVGGKATSDDQPVDNEVVGEERYEDSMIENSCGKRAPADDRNRTIHSWIGREVGRGLATGTYEIWKRSRTVMYSGCGRVQFRWAASMPDDHEACKHLTARPGQSYWGLLWYTALLVRRRCVVPL